MKLIKKVLLVIWALITLFLCFVIFSGAEILEECRDTNITINKKYQRFTALIKEEQELIGTVLDFNGISGKLRKLRKKNTSPLIDYNSKHTLLLMFSHLACNTCMETEMKIYRDINKSKPGNISIRAVCFSDTTKYIRRFFSLNRIKFPVFIDKEKWVINQLSTNRQLLIMLIDNQTQTIITSYIPDPLFPQRSRIFNNTITKLNDLH